jgi:hypothetical protein
MKTRGGGERNYKEMAVSARRLLQYLQSPNKNSSAISRHIIFGALRNSYVLTLLFLREPLTMFCGILFKKHWFRPFTEYFVYYLVHSDVRNTTALTYIAVSWGLLTSGMWGHVTEWRAPDVSRARSGLIFQNPNAQFFDTERPLTTRLPRCLETSGTNHPETHNIS